MYFKLILLWSPVFKPQILGVVWPEGLAVTLKLSTQAVESSVAVGPAVMKDSKSNLTVQTSEKKQNFCLYNTIPIIRHEIYHNVMIKFPQELLRIYFWRRRDRMRELLVRWQFRCNLSHV